MFWFLQGSRFLAAKNMTNCKSEQYIILRLSQYQIFPTQLLWPEESQNKDMSRNVKIILFINLAGAFIQSVLQLLYISEVARLRSN